MSKIANIFIVVNLVLSVFFLAVVATLLAQKWDYKQMYLELSYRSEQDKREFENDKNDANKRTENFERYLSEAKKMASDYKEKHSDLEKKYNDLKRTNDSYSASLANISSRMDDINKSLTEKDTSIANLRKEKKQAEDSERDARKAKEESLDEQQRIELEFSNLKGELGEKEKMLQRTEKELWEAKQVIRIVRESGIHIPSLIKPAKALDGQISAVSPTVPLVMISLGNDDGVQKGYQFTIYRENRYIGRATVEEVYKDMCAARIIKEMTVQAVQQGDKVTTRLGGGGNY
jgi:hypothetical protein